MSENSCVCPTQGICGPRRATCQLVIVIKPVPCRGATIGHAACHLCRGPSIHPTQGISKSLRPARGWLILVLICSSCDASPGAGARRPVARHTAYEKSLQFIPCRGSIGCTGPRHSHCDARPTQGRDDRSPSMLRMRGPFNSTHAGDQQVTQKRHNTFT